jgi:hypothetical protein
MDWQLVAALLLVIVCAAYLARVAWRSVRGAKGGCGGGCDCRGEPKAVEGRRLIPPDELTLRLRQRGDA